MRTPGGEDVGAFTYLVATMRSMTELVIFRLVLAVVLGSSGVLLVWLARAAASGRVRRNQVAGIRTRTTLASDEAWLAAHRRAEGPTRAAGVAAIVTAAAVLLPVPVEAVMVIVLLGAVAMIGLVLYGAKVGTDAARETETQR